MNSVHGKRMTYFFLISSIAAFALLVFVVFLNVRNDFSFGVSYDAKVYTPIGGDSYCPGDALRWRITSERDRIAPLDIIVNYCDLESALCITDETTQLHPAIFDLRAATTRIRSVTIPDSERLTPGRWAYVQQAAIANSDNWQTYIVPFEIATNCE